MDSSDSPNLERTDQINTDNFRQRIQTWYRGLPDKKRYFEFLTAMLTVPVLLSVLISNYANLRKQQTPESAPTPSVIVEVREVTGKPVQPKDTEPTSATSSPTPGPTITQQTQCTPGIGPIEIAFPEEGSVVNRDPVCLDIPRSEGNYCGVVWSYRINQASWSDYTDRQICMYGLSSGPKQLELRVKSIVTSEERILKRNFSVPGSPTPTPTVASESAHLIIPVSFL